ncbi:hypothetical protein LAT59_01615 [Candidatus Gracilibacteria bacterium]|nr:hypothetical protein [Candidatus Gracilibacteria bacterium]
MKKQYALTILIVIFLYLLYLVISYTYNDYRVGMYIEEIQNTNAQLLENIIETERELEQKTTLAHKNKVLKTEQGLRNRNEEVLFLISEERYRMFTEEQSIELPRSERTINERIGDTENLIASMTIYERWMYFLFGQDIR